MTTRGQPALAPPDPIDLAGYARLARGLRDLLGIDLDQYRPAQMWRRVNDFASRRGLAGVDALLAACRRNPDLLAEVRDMLMINVSEFFRDPEAWERLGQRIGGQVAGPRLYRAWSAGCALGFEPYSLAMLAIERFPSTPVHIVATDVDRTALAVGRAGRFDVARVAGLSPERRDRFLVADGPAWVFRPEVRAMIGFREHDLMNELTGGKAFDLVLCRNVVIYFTEVAKAAVHRRLVEALRPGGLLFVGATEVILQPGALGLVPVAPGLYLRET